jgi:hypothetical protein
MDGSLPGTWLTGRLAERQADLDRLIAEERARPAPDEMLVRRLMRERMLARDRLAALSGAAMPVWARPGAAPAE